jgi:hypothetical protein
MFTLFPMFSFVVSYWKVIVPLIPVVGGLSYIAFLTRDIRVALTVCAIVGLTIYSGTIYKRGYDTKVAEIESDMRRIVAARDRTISEINTTYEQNRASDATRIAELERLVNDTPANTRPALDRAAAGRVRSIRP